MTVKEFKEFVKNIDEEYDNEIIYTDVFNNREYSEEIKSIDAFYSTIDKGLYFNISQW